MNGALPKVSIIIPVYNAEKYLRECLDSVVNQTLADIEIICVNDGSTDGSPAILREYAAKDARLRLIDQVNTGPSAARNRGLDLARGEYIQFVDADDRVDTTLCEKTYTLAMTEGSDVVVFNFARFTHTISKDRAENFKSLPSVKNDTIWLLKTFGGAPTKLISKNIYTKYNIRFPTDIKLTEDELAHWQAACSARSFSVVDETLYFYRRASNSLCHRVGYPLSATWFAVYFLIRPFLEQKKVEPEISRFFVSRSFLNFYCTYLRTRKADREKAKAIVRSFLLEYDSPHFIKETIRELSLSLNSVCRIYCFYKMMQGSRLYTVLFYSLQTFARYFLVLIKRY